MRAPRAPPTRTRPTRRLLGALVVGVLAGGVFAGCGSDDRADGSELPGPGATEFNERFAKLTGIRLVEENRTNAKVWNVLSLPDGTEHFDRFGVFSLYVVKDRTTRDRLLRKSENDRAPLKPNAEGIAFRLSGATDSYSAVQRFDENIVLVWQAGDSPKVDDSYRRLATAVEASVTGDESKIPAAQRDCKQAGIDPVSGKEGECRVGDRVVTIVNSSSELRTPLLKARLRSVGDAARIEPSSSYGDPQDARGRYLIVRYTLTNSAKAPIDGVEPQLVVDGRTYASARRVDYDLYGDAGRPFPIQPTESSSLVVAFDIPPAVVDAARKRGALVLPAESEDDGGYLSVDDDAVAEGRIRLAGAKVDSSAGGAPPSDPGGRDPSDRKSLPSPSRSSKSIVRRQRAERAVKEFFTAARAGSAPGVCSRLTESAIAKEGGKAACRGKVVLRALRRQVPNSNRGLRFTTILTRSDTRATVVISSSGYRGIARLARQQGRWRIQGLRGRRGNRGSRPGTPA